MPSAGSLEDEEDCPLYITPSSPRNTRLSLCLPVLADSLGWDLSWWHQPRTRPDSICPWQAGGHDKKVPCPGELGPGDMEVTCSPTAGEVRSLEEDGDPQELRKAELGGNPFCEPGN